MRGPCSSEKSRDATGHGPRPVARHTAATAARADADAPRWCRKIARGPPPIDARALHTVTRGHRTAAPRVLPSRGSSGVL